MSIRGKQIMIDRDLAELYGVETKRLNEAVKRNIERFPERFRFQLTKEEMAELVANCDRFYSHRLKASCATNGYFYKLYAPLQANCPQLADNFIEGLYIADIQRLVAQRKNRPQFADDFKDRYRQSYHWLAYL